MDTHSLWQRGDRARDLSPSISLLQICDMVRPILWNSPIAFLQWAAALVSGGLLCSDSLWAAVPLSLLCAESCDCRGVFAEEAVSHTSCVDAASHCLLLWGAVTCGCSASLKAAVSLLCILRGAVTYDCLGCRFILLTEGTAFYTAVGFYLRVLGPRCFSSSNPKLGGLKVPSTFGIKRSFIDPWTEPLSEHNNKDLHQLWYVLFSEVR